MRNVKYCYDRKHELHAVLVRWTLHIELKAAMCLSSSNTGTKHTSHTDKVQTSKHIPHLSHLLRQNVALSEIVSFFNSTFHFSCIHVILPVMPTSLFIKTSICYDPDKGICAHKLSSTPPAISSNLAPILTAGSLQ